MDGCIDGTCKIVLKVLSKRYINEIVTNMEIPKTGKTASVLKYIKTNKVAIEISNYLICFCTFDLSCPILEKEHFIKNLHIVLSSH